MSSKINVMARLFQGSEPAPVQTFVSKLAVKAFNKRVLGWLSRLNEAKLYAPIPTPEERRFTGKLRPIVTDDGVLV